MLQAGEAHRAVRAQGSTVRHSRCAGCSTTTLPEEEVVTVPQADVKAVEAEAGTVPVAFFTVSTCSVCVCVCVCVCL